MDPGRARATALAVLGGRIVAVGNGDELHRHLDAERVVSFHDRSVQISTIEALATVVGGRIAQDRMGPG